MPVIGQWVGGVWLVAAILGLVAELK
jgi:hypothetical protein